MARFMGVGRTGKDMSVTFCKEEVSNQVCCIGTKLYNYFTAERLSATSHQPYRRMLDYTRTLQPNESHLSRFNSELIKIE